MQLQPLTIFSTGAVQPCWQETDDETWKNLYQDTTVFVRKFLSRIDIPVSWKGQEEDVAEDIVQETMVRVLDYLKRADRREVLAPKSLTAFAVVVARNYLWDLRRREYRLRLMHDDEANGRELEQAQIPALDQAVDNVETECLFLKAAVTVAQFPDKQRKAVLADLANCMHFGRKQTVLQKAFSSVGIHLQDYQWLYPIERKERARQSSLRSLAYKRVARELSPW